MSIIHKVNPRVYIYPIVVLCVCFFMQKHYQKIAAASGQAPVERIEHKPIVKASEMGAASSLPKLYIFGDETSVPFADDIRARMVDKCTIMHIVNSDKEMQDYFKIATLPAAILFDDGHEEIARFNPPFSEDKLVKELEEALASAKK